MTNTHTHTHSQHTDTDTDGDTNSIQDDDRNTHHHIIIDTNSIINNVITIAVIARKGHPIGSNLISIGFQEPTRVITAATRSSGITRRGPLEDSFSGNSVSVSGAACWQVRVRHKQGWGASSKSRPILPREPVEHLSNKQTYRPRLEVARRPTGISGSVVLVRGEPDAQRCGEVVSATQTSSTVAAPCMDRPRHSRFPHRTYGYR